MDKLAAGSRLALAVLLAPVLAHLAFGALPGFGSYVVLSGSMQPTLASDSLVYVRETDDYHVGDVITFVHEGSVVTHRVIEREPDGLVTKGDDNDEADPWLVPRDDVLGEVVASVPLYGHLVRFASTTVGFVLTVVLPGVALLLRELVHLRRALGE